jgi:hypothetical protein
MREATQIHCGCVCWVNKVLFNGWQHCFHTIYVSTFECVILMHLMLSATDLSTSGAFISTALRYSHITEDEYHRESKTWPDIQDKCEYSAHSSDKLQLIFCRGSPHNAAECLGPLLFLGSYGFQFTTGILPMVTGNFHFREAYGGRLP